VEDYQVTILATGVGVPATSYRNPQNPLDVSGDGQLTLNDVLLLINDLRMNGARQLPMPPPPGQEPPPFLDPSGDGRITLNDVLLVINGLLIQNAQAAGEGEGESELAAPFVPHDARLAGTAPNFHDEDEPQFCAAVAAAPDAGGPHASAAAETATVDLTDESEEDDWDHTLDAIAGDVSLAWEKSSI
jgi:hypothetical protein